MFTVKPLSGPEFWCYVTVSTLVTIVWAWQFVHWLWYAVTKRYGTIPGAYRFPILLWFVAFADFVAVLSYRPGVFIPGTKPAGAMIISAYMVALVYCLLVLGAIIVLLADTLATRRYRESLHPLDYTDYDPDRDGDAGEKGSLVGHDSVERINANRRRNRLKYHIWAGYTMSAIGIVSLVFAILGFLHDIEWVSQNREETNHYYLGRLRNDAEHPPHPLHGKRYHLSFISVCVCSGMTIVLVLYRLWNKGACGNFGSVIELDPADQLATLAYLCSGIIALIHGVVVTVGLHTVYELHTINEILFIVALVGSMCNLLVLWLVKRITKRSSFRARPALLSKDSEGDWVETIEASGGRVYKDVAIWSDSDEHTKSLMYQLSKVIRSKEVRLWRPPDKEDWDTGPCVRSKLAWRHMHGRYPLSFIILPAHELDGRMPHEKAHIWQAALSCSLRVIIVVIANSDPMQGSTDVEGMEGLANRDCEDAVRIVKESLEHTTMLSNENKQVGVRASGKWRRVPVVIAVPPPKSQKNDSDDDSRSDDSYTGASRQAGISEALPLSSQQLGGILRFFEDGHRP